MPTLAELGMRAARNGFEVHEVIDYVIRTHEMTWAALYDAVQHAWFEAGLGGLVIKVDDLTVDHFGVGAFDCRPDNIDRIRLLASHAIAFYKIVGHGQISYERDPIMRRIPSWVPQWVLKLYVKWFW